MTDAIYIDTSCILKLVIEEPDSDEVRATCNASRSIVVSSLAELETRSRLLALLRGGEIRERVHGRLVREVEGALANEPFRVERLSGEVFDHAIAQVKRRGAKACNSLDRLHLAAMAVLGLTSILTKDARQAAVAKSLGYTVIA